MSAIKISSTSSLLNLHVIKPFEFIGKKAVTPVTIFLKLAGSILTCLVESSRKFFLYVLWIFYCFICIITHYLIVFFHLLLIFKMIGSKYISFLISTDWRLGSITNVT